MTGLEQSLEAACRKFGSAGEQDVHGSGTRSGLARRHRSGRRRLTSRCPNPAPITNRQGPNPASSRLAELFLKFGLDALLLQARKIVDKNLALEMIHFVLDTDSQELLRDERKRSSV